MTMEEIPRWMPPQPEVGSVVYDIMRRAEKKREEEGVWAQEFFLQKAYRRLAADNHDEKTVLVYTIETDALIPEKHFHA